MEDIQYYHRLRYVLFDIIESEAVEASLTELRALMEETARRAVLAAQGKKP